MNFQHRTITISDSIKEDNNQKQMLELVQQSLTEKICRWGGCQNLNNLILISKQ